MEAFLEALLIYVAILEFCRRNEFHPLPIQWKSGAAIYSTIKRTTLEKHNKPPYCLCGARKCQEDSAVQFVSKWQTGTKQMAKTMNTMVLVKIATAAFKPGAVFM